MQCLFDVTSITSHVVVSINEYLTRPWYQTPLNAILLPLSCINIYSVVIYLSEFICCLSVFRNPSSLSLYLPSIINKASFMFTYWNINYYNPYQFNSDKTSSFCRDRSSIYSCQQKLADIDVLWSIVTTVKGSFFCFQVIFSVLDVLWSNWHIPFIFYLFDAPWFWFYIPVLFHILHETHFIILNVNIHFVCHCFFYQSPWTLIKIDGF